MIPLPPLPEQQRIVARIESLAAKIEEASQLRGQTVEETEVFLARAASQILDSPKWNCMRLECVLAESPRNGLSPQRETESDGRPMLRINAVSSTTTRFVDLSAYKEVEVADDVAAPYVLQHDDVFIVRYNGDINRVAKAAIFKGERNTEVVYPDKLMRLRTDHKQMLPDFLVVALGSRRVRGQKAAPLATDAARSPRKRLFSTALTRCQNSPTSYLPRSQAGPPPLPRSTSNTAWNGSAHRVSTRTL